MIYGFSLLAFTVSLVTGIPALRGLWRMRNINKNCARTTGTVKSSRSAMGWLWAASFGNQDRPLVSYISPRGTEMVLEVVTSSILPQQRYQPGQSIDVIYDIELPGRAYVKDEWTVSIREVELAIAALIAGILFWAIGRYFNMPF